MLKTRVDSGHSAQPFRMILNFTSNTSRIYHKVVFSSKTLTNDDTDTDTDALVTTIALTVLFYRRAEKWTVILTLVMLNPDVPCLCKECRSRSVGF